MTSAIYSSVCRSAMGCHPGIDRPERSSIELPKQDNSQGLESDLLSLSDPTSLTTELTTGERLAVRIRSQASLVQSDDGSVAASVRTRLRFSYEFQSSDGTTIRISAKASLKYLQVADDDSEAAALKLRVKARVSILQQDVASGVGELVDGSTLTEEARTALSQAIGLFQEATDALSSTFAASNPLDGDSLINGLVEAFNALATSANPQPPQTLPASPQPPTDASVESGVESATRPAASVALPSAPTMQPEAGVPAAERPETPLPVPAADELTTSGDSTEVADSAASDVSAANDVMASEGGSPLITDPPSSMLASDAAPAVSVRSVMLQVRMKVVESLTHLVTEFDSPNGHLTASRSIYRASINLAAQYSYLTQDSPALTTIDTQV